jgi:alkane 1-monooxygenase
MRHLAALALPLLTLISVATGPHPPWTALLGIPLVVLVIWLDGRPRRGWTPTRGPRWAFTMLVVALALIQITTLALLVRLVAQVGFRWDLVFIGWFVGNNSGWGTIVVAHELIHRRSPPLRWLGRALLWTVLYDHFYVEHLRGHHVRVATPDDPATARFDESYFAFMRRTVPGQWWSAWRLAPLQVLFGIAVELVLLGAIFFAAGGWAAVAMMVWQAYHAIGVLETVNYFEHWGLTRAGARRGRPSVRDAWDSDSWLTEYSLIGLARHADHHAHASRPFQELMAVEESPKLPRGYYGLVALAQLRNRTFRALMIAELQRRKLGPFTTP